MVLDPETGEPRAFFHRTAEDVQAFDLNHANLKDTGRLAHGVYVTSDTSLRSHKEACGVARRGRQCDAAVRVRAKLLRGVS